MRRIVQSCTAYQRFSPFYMDHSRPNNVEVLHLEGERTLQKYDGNSRDVGVSEDVEVRMNDKIGE